VLRRRSRPIPVRVGRPSQIRQLAIGIYQPLRRDPATGEELSSKAGRKSEKLPVGISVAPLETTCVVQPQDEEMLSLASIASSRRFCRAMATQSLSAVRAIAIHAGGHPLLH
jgi:hypothetical protein